MAEVSLEEDKATSSDAAGRQTIASASGAIPSRVELVAIDAG
jgi:hypothetical protein